MDSDTKARAAWDKANDEQRKALRAHPEVKAMVATIQLERATANVDEDAPSISDLLKVG